MMPSDVIYDIITDGNVHQFHRLYNYEPVVPLKSLKAPQYGENTHTLHTHTHTHTHTTHTHTHAQHTHTHTHIHNTHSPSVHTHTHTHMHTHMHTHTFITCTYTYTHTHTHTHTPCRQVCVHPGYGGEGWECETPGDQDGLQVFTLPRHPGACPPRWEIHPPDQGGLVHLLTFLPCIL